MSQVAVLSPLDKLELPHQIWLQPSALFHFLSGQSYAPPPGLQFRKIGERACVHVESLEALEEFHP